MHVCLPVEDAPDEPIVDPGSYTDREFVTPLHRGNDDAEGLACLVKTVLG